MTGSANIMLVPKLSDSLAGRIEMLNLHPLAQCEIAGWDPGFLEKLFTSGFKQERYRRLGPGLAEILVAGGFPPALGRTQSRRMEWYGNYTQSLIQRDVSDLARIQSLEILPKLLSAMAGQTANLFNISELAGPFELSRPTIRLYATLLQGIFLMDVLPPWYNNKLKRLIKTPKIHLTDSGLAAALSGVDAAGLLADRTQLGQLLETFVFQELKRHASWGETRTEFHHYRDKDGVEVDLVLERGNKGLAGVEVKASSTVQSRDFKGLRKLKEAAGKKFAGGVVLYDGELSVRFEESLYAVPISALWEKPRK
jgi:predicted AAA+ superfamily ATPase